MDTAEKRPVRVNLLGRSYTLLAQGDAREVERLALRVDEMMHEIARRVPNADSTQIAVLTCMHLADRLNDLEKSFQTLREHVDRKTEQLGLLLDQAIDPE